MKKLVEINNRLSWKQYNYINEDGSFLLKRNVYNATEFNENHAIIAENLNGKFVREILDNEGNKTIIPNDYLVQSNYSNGMLVVKENRKTSGVVHNIDYINNIGINGYIDVNGNVVINPEYKYAFDFKNEKAIVVKDKYEIDSNNNFSWKGYEKWGVIDKKQNTIVPFEYNDIQEIRYKDKICYRVIKGNFEDTFEELSFGILDENNKFILDMGYKFIDSGIQNDRYVKFSNQEIDDMDIKYGVFDFVNKKIVLEPCFKQLEFLGNGIIKFSNKDEFDFNSRYGIYDLKTNKIIVQEEYINIEKDLKEDNYKLTKGNVLNDNNLRLIRKENYKNDFKEEYANQIFEYYTDNNFNILYCKKA